MMDKVVFCLRGGASLLLIVVLTFGGYAQTKSSWGIGSHIMSPTSFSNCCTESVQGRGMFVPSLSVLFKKEWELRPKNKLFVILDLSTNSLGYRELSQPNEEERRWDVWTEVFNGIPSTGITIGKSWELSKKRISFNYGLNVSLRITNSLKAIRSHNFGISRPVGEKDIAIPIFVRPYLGISMPYKMFDKMGSQIDFFVMPSFQNLIKGDSYVYSYQNNNYTSGSFKVNYSTIGLHFFFPTKKEAYRFLVTKKKKRKVQTGDRQKPTISLNTQLFSNRSTQYHIQNFPDSFALKSSRIVPSVQAGLNVRFPTKNNWFFNIGTGVGQRSTNFKFIAESNFTQTGEKIETSILGGSIGYYAILNVGFGKKRDESSKFYQYLHSTWTIPFGQASTGTSIYEVFDVVSPQYEILKLEFDDSFGINRVLFGLEYGINYSFNKSKPIGFSIGPVLNYSWGVLGQGKIQVMNGKSNFWGGAIQGFSKIGISINLEYNRNYLYDGLN